MNYTDNYTKGLWRLTDAIVEMEAERKRESRYGEKSSEKVEYFLRAYKSAFYMMTDVSTNDPRFNELVEKYYREGQAYMDRLVCHKLGKFLTKHAYKDSEVLLNDKSVTDQHTTKSEPAGDWYDG